MNTTTEDDSTRARILELVEDLVMRRGYNAISYQDVADGIGIRKASVHYHFPNKADLGEAVIDAYLAKMQSVAAPLEDMKSTQFAAALEDFLSMFTSVAEQGDKVCLAGILGAEFETLPEPVQQKVRAFYGAGRNWLAALLAAGRDAGVFSFEGDPGDRAWSLFSMLEGALIIRRAMKDEAALDAAVSEVRAHIARC